MVPIIHYEEYASINVRVCPYFWTHNNSDYKKIERAL